MGLILWIAAGVVAFLLGRAIERNRPARAAGELLVAIATALAAGFIATALDFGGWKEVDWRAGAFSALIASASIAVRRVFL